MSEVRVGENESLESALRRFKRKCARAGVLAEIRKREHYEKPSVMRLQERENTDFSECIGNGISPVAFFR